MFLQRSKALVLPFHTDTVLMAATCWSSSSLAPGTAKWPSD